MLHKTLKAEALETKRLRTNVYFGNSIVEICKQIFVANTGPRSKVRPARPRPYIDFTEKNDAAIAAAQW